MASRLSSRDAPPWRPAPRCPRGKGGGFSAPVCRPPLTAGPTHQRSPIDNRDETERPSPRAPRGRRGDARRGAGTCSPSTAATCAPPGPTPPNSPRHGPRERRFCIPHTQPSPAPAPAPGRRPCLCGPKGAQPARRTCAATAPYPHGKELPGEGRARLRGLGRAYRRTRLAVSRTSVDDCPRPRRACSIEAAEGLAQAPHLQPPSGLAGPTKRRSGSQQPRHAPLETGVPARPSSPQPQVAAYGHERGCQPQVGWCTPARVRVAAPAPASRRLPAPPPSALLARNPRPPAARPAARPTRRQRT